MYYMILSVMLSSSTVTAQPMLVGEYTSEIKCLSELSEIAKLPDFKRAMSPIFGRIIFKKTEDKETLLFCVRDMRSV